VHTRRAAQVGAPPLNCGVRGHIVRSHALTVTGLLLFATPIAWACGHCVKDILSPAEFDQRAWESSQKVFVAIVTAAESSRINEYTLEIDYRVEVEEVLKGTFDDFDQRLFTTRSISDWKTGIEQIACGDTLINVGDRLLVFADATDAIPIGRCSSTRVIEGIAAASADEVSGTLSRDRRWR
jgi:hypothetical protein